MLKSLIAVVDSLKVTTWRWTTHRQSKSRWSHSDLPKSTQLRPRLASALPGRPQTSHLISKIRAGWTAEILAGQSRIMSKRTTRKIRWASSPSTLKIKRHLKLPQSLNTWRTRPWVEAMTFSRILHQWPIRNSTKSYSWSEISELNDCIYL